MKRLATVLLIVFALTLVTSCASSLSVTYNQPSNINMSKYQNIAIASAQSYNGKFNAPFFIRNMIFDNTIVRYELYPTTYNFTTLSNSVTKYVTNMVNKAFSTPSSKGYFHVLDNTQTDTYLSFSKIGRDVFQELKNAGYDAVLIPRVSVLDCDEFITASWSKDKNGNKVAKYYLERILHVNITLSVVDTTTGQIAVQRSYENKFHDKMEFDPTKTSYFSDKLSYSMVGDCLSGMLYGIIDDFVPTERNTYISLMANKPKLPILESAFSAAKSGNLDYALQVFKNTYETQGHIASGYNAAVILASQNNLDDAILILDNIRSKTNNRRVNNLYSELTLLRTKNEEAAIQMTSTSAPVEQNTQGSILDYLLN